MDIPFSGNVCPHCNKNKSGDQLMYIIGWVVGIVLLLGLVGYLSKGSGTTKSQPPLAPKAVTFQPLLPARTFTVTVHNALGQGQLKEEVSITLGGVEKTIVIDGLTPRAAVYFTGVGVGSRPYSIRCRTLIMIGGISRWVTSNAGGSLSVNSDLQCDLVGTYRPLTQTFETNLRPRS
jgi:hypothetical protein